MLIPLLASLAARAAEVGPEVDALVAQARALGLDRREEWLRLGHWRKRLFGGFQSEADGPDFFLANNGKDDPAAELEATLRALYGQLSLTDEQRARNTVPPQCRFPARAAWLLGELRPPALPQLDCPRFDEYFQRLQAESVSLIFSSYYLNNPASIFGHTFLRIKKRSENVPADKRELLDSGIDFSATPDTGNPLFYAFKGLTGMFPGVFHLFPYYYKVREYNDYESRDVWEYELSLTPKQLAMLQAHLFELGSTWFDYFYIDENCSYQILAALEAAGPELKLLDSVKLPVVPADTVKALYRNPGLVARVRYRPSARTQFRARVEGMDRAARNAVEALADDPEAPLPADGRVRILDAAADLIDVRYAKELPFQPDGKGGTIKRRVLERRAEIREPSPELVVPPPLDRRPDFTHGSTRAFAAWGGSTADGPLLSVGYRFALHDLVDAPAGYPELSQIEFLTPELRFYPRSRSLQLESFDLVNVLSLQPATMFDPALSWLVRAGLRRLRDGACQACLAGAGRLGSGFTLATAGESLSLFAFGVAEVDTAPKLQGIAGAPALRAGAGPYGGLRLRLGQHVVAVADADWLFFPYAIEHTAWSVSASLRVSPSQSWAVGLAGRRERGASEGLLQLFGYY